VKMPQVINTTMSSIGLQTILQIWVHMRQLVSSPPMPPSHKRFTDDCTLDPADITDANAFEELVQNNDIFITTTLDQPAINKELGEFTATRVVTTRAAIS
jgi:hypothetical protein